ncbi:MAG: PEP-CTERM sorting domain-containing protein [Armatimonadetes bacterium]|nr:PEP-CTERM sorting domain-containing protein [Armatimonadota bacterium]
MARSFFIALGLVATAAVNAQTASNYSFDIHTLRTDRALKFKSLNDSGDVTGFYHETTGVEKGFVYNPSTGFQDIALGNNDVMFGNFTSGGYVYSQNKGSSGNADPNSGIYRTSVGGTKTLLDLTNGGTLSLGTTITNTVLADDDRVSFWSGGHYYVWSQATGTQQLADGYVVSFGPSGSMFLKTSLGIEKVDSGGNHSIVDPPSGSDQYGTFVGYKELASGTKQYTFTSPYTGTQTELVVPVGGYASNIFRHGSSVGDFGITYYWGDHVLAINDNGLAITGNNAGGEPYRLNNPMLYDVKNDATGTVYHDTFLDAQFASTGYIVGISNYEASTGFETVYGTYTGFAEPLPEPASFAILGVGCLALMRRKKTS